jgi:hypothetical protein
MLRTTDFCGLVAIGITAVSGISGCRGKAHEPPRERPRAPAATTDNHIALPKVPHEAIVPTRVLDAATFTRLAAIDHPDFMRQPRATTATSTEIHFTTQSRPTLGVTVEVAVCTSDQDCPAMRIDVWEAKRAELRGLLPAELRDRTDTSFDFASRKDAGLGDDDGTSMIYTYALGAAATTGGNGQPAGAYIDAYTLYYNDGINRFRVMANYADDAIGLDRMKAVAPLGDLEKIATSFLSFYVHECEQH